MLISDAGAIAADAIDYLERAGIVVSACTPYLATATDGYRVVLRIEAGPPFQLASCARWWSTTQGLGGVLLDREPIGTDWSDWIVNQAGQVPRLRWRYQPIDLVIASRLLADRVIDALGSPWLRYLPRYV